MTPVATVLGQGQEHAVEHAGADPRLVAAVTGLIGRIALGQIVPGRAGLQDPEDAVQHITRVTPGAAPAVGATARLGQQRLQHDPLRIGEVHESTPRLRAVGV
jgi:hypothetical protein